MDTASNVSFNITAVLDNDTASAVVLNAYNLKSLIDPIIF